MAAEGLGRTSHTQRCEACGMTSTRFDPPIAIEAVKGCGAHPPGSWASGGSVTSWVDGVTITHQVDDPIPHCQLPEGHEGNHFFYTEHATSWDNPQSPLVSSVTVG